MHLKFHQNNFIWAYLSVSFLSDCFLQAKTGDTIITKKSCSNNATVGAVESAKNRFQSNNINEHYFCETREPTSLMLSGFVELEIILNK